LADKTGGLWLCPFGHGEFYGAECPSCADGVPPYTPEGYNEGLEPDEQITMEERIAGAIFDAAEWREGEEPPTDWPNEEECAELGRKTLLMVLGYFRPDLVEYGPPDDVDG
jgi:hypothetical protein